MAYGGDFIRPTLRMAPVCCAVRNSDGDSLHAAAVAQYATLIALLAWRDGLGHSGGTPPLLAERGLWCLIWIVGGSWACSGPGSEEQF